MLDISLDTFSQKDFFFQFLQCSYRDVEGVYKLDSGKPGPTIGVTIFTHGNEPSGLTVFSELFEFFRHNTLQKGSVIFCINNIDAAKKFLQAESVEEKRQSRFCKVNMNRLSEKSLMIEFPTDSEIVRLQKLAPIYEEFDYGIDIHSTEQECEPMIITIGKVDLTVAKNVAIEKIITNIDVVQIGVPIGYFYGGKKDIPVVELECGSHENLQTGKIAALSTLQILSNIGVISGQVFLEKPFEVYKNYNIVDSILFPNNSYTLQRELPMFCEVSEGEIIGIGSGENVVCRLSGHALMAPKGKTPSNFAEEVVFISEKVKDVVV